MLIKALLDDNNPLSGAIGCRSKTDTHCAAARPHLMIMMIVMIMMMIMIMMIMMMITRGQVHDEDADDDLGADITDFVIDYEYYADITDFVNADDEAHGSASNIKYGIVVNVDFYHLCEVARRSVHWRFPAEVVSFTLRIPDGFVSLRHFCNFYRF